MLHEPQHYSIEWKSSGIIIVAAGLDCLVSVWVWMLDSGVLLCFLTNLICFGFTNLLFHCLRYFSYLLYYIKFSSLLLDLKFSLRVNPQASCSHLFYWKCKFLKRFYLMLQHLGSFFCLLNFSIKKKSNQILRKP